MARSAVTCSERLGSERDERAIRRASGSSACFSRSSRFVLESDASGGEARSHCRPVARGSRRSRSSPGRCCRRPITIGIVVVASRAASNRRVTHGDDHLRDRGRRASDARAGSRSSWAVRIPCLRGGCSDSRPSLARRARRRRLRARGRLIGEPQQDTDSRRSIRQRLLCASRRAGRRCSAAPAEPRKARRPGAGGLAGEGGDVTPARGRAAEGERRPLERGLALELDRLLPLVERVAVALGHAADLGHGALVEAQTLGDLLVGEAGLVDPLERVAELQHLVLVAPVDLGIEPEDAPCYLISLSPWAAGTRACTRSTARCSSIE